MFKLRGPQDKPRLVGFTAAELMAKQYPPREFAVDPWLRTGETALVWASSGVGKTWLTLSLAIAMAGGGKVWEWSAPKPRKVLIIDGEMNEQDLSQRLRTLVDIGAVTGLDMVTLGSNLRIMPRQSQDPDCEFFDVTDKTSQSHILQAMEDTGSEVVIIDNITTVADGLQDENDATAFRPIMSFLMKMKQAGKTAIVVHHANKSGNDARGSTALEATFEVKLGLHPAPFSVVGRASFIAKFGKFRARGDDRIQARKWTLGDEGWTVEEDDSEGAGNAVLDAIRSTDFINGQEIADALGKSKMYVSRQLEKLDAQKVLTKKEREELYAAAKGRRRGAFDDPEFEPETALGAF